MKVHQHGVRRDFEQKVCHAKPPYSAHFVEETFEDSRARSGIALAAEKRYRVDLGGCHHNEAGLPRIAVDQQVGDRSTALKHPNVLHQDGSTLGLLLLLLLVATRGAAGHVHRLQHTPHV